MIKDSISFLFNKSDNLKTSSSDFVVILKEGSFAKIGLTKY